MGQDKEEFCGLDLNWRYYYNSEFLKNTYLLSTYLSNMRLKGLRCNESPETKSTPYVQILTSKY